MSASSLAEPQPPTDSESLESPQPRTHSVESRDLTEDILKTVLYHDIVKSLRVPPKDLGLPLSLKHYYPESWNFHFQKAYGEKYGPNADLKSWKKENTDIGLLAYLGNVRACEQEIAVTTKVLLRAEGSLIALAMNKFAHDDLENGWNSLDVDKRTDLVLEGLVRGAIHARELSRLDCPEMCVFRLSGAREKEQKRGFIDLLKAIIAHDPTGNGSVKSLYMFSHPAVENEYEYVTTLATPWPPEMRAFGLLRILQRNLYIVQALTGILKAYSGVAAIDITPKDEWEAQQRGIVCVGCYSCGATPNDDAVTLRKCGGCRSVTYCSEDCQQRDWRQHKKLCNARPVRVDHIIAPSSEALPEFLGCPQAQPGFIRSPALRQQIQHLSQRDSHARDYHFDTAPNHTQSVRIHDPIRRLDFLVARKRAMASGDHAAVRKMHDILQRMQRAGLIDLTATQIRDQLEREYGLDLGAEAPKEELPSNPTKEEMKEQLGLCFKRDLLAESQRAGEGAKDDLTAVGSLAVLGHANCLGEGENPKEGYSDSDE
ncbi:hypothetical protein B0H16DRAFT_1687215 [Mycena metata]|uniref:MYND-type domain-containing protein n=1 Tax=Mycena metata TaxID=1033252 RepID=A0AAD7JJL2_9AGAR|nr:hypothetical protein B0H16DRAFT_1687215 [Mycena metata]